MSLPRALLNRTSSQPSHRHLPLLFHEVTGACNDCVSVCREMPNHLIAPYLTVTDLFLESDSIIEEHGLPAERQ